MAFDDCLREHWFTITIKICVILLVCLLNGKTAAAADCDHSYTELPHGIDVYEEREEGYVYEQLKFEGNIGQDIRLELVNRDGSNATAYLKLEGKNLTSAHPYDYDVHQSDLHLTVNCYIVPNTLASGSLDIFVFVHDVNDNDPYFKNAPYYAEVNELTPPGFVIFTAIQADDGDHKDDHNKFGFELTGPGSDHFTLTPSEDIEVAMELDYETMPFYQLTLIVRDRVTGGRNGTTFLYINVTDGDDHNPVFNSSSYTATVLEETNNTVLHVEPPIYAYDPDVAIYIVQPIIYSFTSADNLEDYTKLENENFRINSTTGEITVINPIDREELTEDRIRFSVRAAQADKPTFRYTLVIVQVMVLDINDNAPEIMSDNHTAVLAEDAPVGSFVTEVEAHDKDEGDNAVYEFVVFPEDTFEIDTTTLGVFHFGRIRLKDNSMLDADTAPDVYINVTVYAVETETEERLSSQNVTIHIKIEDVNDESPQFSQSIYVGSVFENATNNENVTLANEINATDKDIGEENSAIVYSILTVSNDGNGIFSIDPDAGFVYISDSARLDADTVSSYVLTIAATDRGLTPRSGIANVVIEVLDVDDEGPVFAKSMYSASISEAAVIGSSVTQIQATDADSDSLVYSIDSDVTFAIDMNSGVVTTKLNLDYETTKDYTVVITASDGLHENSTTLVIAIEDANDNSPVFNETSYIFYVLEETVGEVAGNVWATDMDEGLNGQVVYSVLPPFDSNFNISSSGEITTSAKLDRETQESYDIDIQASDSSLTPRMTTMRVTVHVNDINDNLPVFAESNFVGSINEESTGGILTVETTDADTSPNDNTEYVITDGDPRFSINTVSGEISLDSPIDVEVEAGTDFTLEVTSYNVEPYVGSDISNNTVNVTITVLDINDEDPVFQNHTYSVSIEEGLPSQTSILTVKADDLDLISKTSDFIYWLSDGNDEGLFSINPVSGVVMVIGNIDRDPETNHTTFNLTVQVTDRDLKTNNGSASILITVTDINDNEPVFSEVLYEISVNETASLAEVIAVITASDIDSGANGQVISYSFNAVDDYFVIDSDGNVELNTTLDYETRTKYEYTVIATDGGSNPTQTGTASLVITVVNENDEVPAFSKPSYEFEILENSAVDTFVGRVAATDDDGDTISYSIKSSEPSGAPFKIDGSTGDVQVSVSDMLDREDRDNYTVVVTASDGLHKVDVNISVTVLDVNDNTPSFLLPEYTEEMQEDAIDNFAVLQVTAEDKDEGNNSDITYGIQEAGNHGNAFAIRNDGTIYLANSLAIDIDTYSEYMLTVEATDGGSSPRTGLATVIITIIDVNTNPPIFSPNMYTANVLEEEDPPRAVVQVSATDADPQSIITYGIVGDDGPFTVNNNTGEISTNSRLDRESVSSWQLNVSADDGIYSDYATVEISVLDINDNAPEFSEMSYSKTISEIFPPHGTILTVSATDKDEDDQIIYYMEETSDKFAVNFNSGAITLLQSIQDYSFGLQHNLRIGARDSGSPPKSNSTVVTIRINFNVTTNVTEEFAPFFNDTYTASVPENSPFGESVITVMAFDLNPEDRDSLEYSITGDSGSFSIDKYTGEIVVKAIIDRETNTQFDLVVTATDTYGLQNSTTVVITVEDMNDNAPAFKNTPYSVEVEEESDAKVIFTVTADDEDIEENGNVLYELLSHMSLFSINETSGEISTSSGLDRESASLTINDQGLGVYEVTVIAKDQGTVALTSTTTVTVFVTDINDHPPVFNEDSYSGTVVENVPSGQEIILSSIVVVMDKDINQNGNITLRLSGNGNEDFDVSVNEDGIVKLTVSGDIDRESLDMYDLMIIAEDQGIPQMSSNASVTITVLDLNDEPPVFNETSYNGTVAETQPRMTLVDMTPDFVAYDRDLPPNNLIIYSIDAGNDDNKFLIGQLDGKIYTLEPLDYEAGDTSFTLTVSAMNFGRNDLKSTVMVTITVMDEAETTTAATTVPMTTERPSDEYFEFEDEEDLGRTIPSDLPSNETVAEVIARNPEGLRDGIYYNITNQTVQLSPDDTVLPSDQFMIDSLTGVITLAKPINGNVGLFILDVTAWNITDPSLYSTVTVEITVVGPNNTAPKFMAPSYSAEIKDDDVVGTMVTVVSANDDDSPTYGNGQFQYMFEENNPSTDYFNINQNGVITVKKSLLPIATYSVEFVVVAKDGGLPPLNDTTVVMINITRMFGNLYSPVITPPIMLVQIKEDIKPGSIIHTVNATDEDPGIGGEFVFEIQYAGSHDGSANQMFDIDPLYGNISTQAAFDYDNGATYYQIMVYAEDRGYPPRRGYGVIGITILDVNDNAPEFQQSDGPLHVIENAANVSVGKVVATDSDSGDNAYVEYSITGGSGIGLFYIDAKSGEIFTEAELDREDPASNGMYNLSITATNSRASPQESAEVTIEIVIDDVNDNPPEFQGSYPSPIVIPLRSEIGHSVTTVEATDKDKGDNAKISYMLSPGSAYFTIDRDSGEIKTSASFDESDTSQAFNLTVVAYDGGYPRMEASLHLTINVLDYSAGQPTFLDVEGQEHTMPVAMENQPAGTYSHKIPAAYDPLDVDGLYIRYYIVGGNDPEHFVLDPVTGILKTTSQLDRETVSEYRLQIQAVSINTTSGTGRRKRDISLPHNEIYIVIPVGDVNDNEPVFVSDNYIKGIMDDTTFGSSVLQVQAVDLDAGNFSVVSYRMDNLDRSRKFAVQPNTGVINTADVFSNKAGETYSFKVHGRDNHGRGLSSDVPATVTIHVLTVNDLGIVTSELPPLDAIENLDEILEDLANLTGLIIDSTRVGPRVEGDNVNQNESDIWFYGVDPETGEIVPIRDILDLISQAPQKPGDIDQETFERDWKVITITEIHDRIKRERQQLSGLVIALIALGIIILIFCIFAIVAVFMWWEKRESEKMRRKQIWADMYPLPSIGVGIENPGYEETKLQSSSSPYIDSGSTYVTRDGKTYSLGPDGNPVEVVNGKTSIYVEYGTSTDDLILGDREVEGGLSNDNGYESQELTMDMFVDTSDFDEVSVRDLLLRLENIDPTTTPRPRPPPSETSYTEGVPFTKL